jgi:predicted dithiol-disulfide oxidoreductase (DUF899 family)
MSLPPVVSREQWLAARKDLLSEEKALTRARDELDERRRSIGMVAVPDHRFEGPSGEVGLADLFDGRSQLVVQHFMFDPAWDDGCPSCSWAADEISDGRLRHLDEAGVAFAVVSRAPFAKLADYRRRRGWRYPWYSSGGSSFDRDFGVAVDWSEPGATYNYRTLEEFAGLGQPVGVGEGLSDYPGLSCLLRDGDQVFHTYSTYARGTETIGGSHYILDLTALGRASAP